MRAFPLVIFAGLAIATLLPGATAASDPIDAFIADAHANACRYVPDGPPGLDPLRNAPVVGEDLNEALWDLEEPRAACERNVGNVFLPGEIEL